MSGKILIVGPSGMFHLEQSYARAAKEIGLSVDFFDIPAETKKHVPFGKIGLKFHTVVPVDLWTRKLNRTLIIRAKEIQPDYILVFTNAPVLAGSLVTLKLVCPAARLVWVWPDTPMNLRSNTIESALLFDFSAVYSSSAVPLLQRLGFNNVHWIPLAGDAHMHYVEAPQTDNFSTDISFVGAWRPERERALEFIIENFPSKKIEIYGYYWKSDCKNKKLLQHLKGDGFYGNALSQFFNKSRININVIDDTNYPAANMRFFEVSVAGGLQVVNPCPEMENVFRHKEHLLYFKNEQELADNLQWAFDNPDACAQLRRNAQSALMQGHTYSHRLNKILESL